MLNREDVIYAFRMILGREPESVEIVDRYATEVTDLPTLRELFLNSVEFRLKFSDLSAKTTPKPGLVGPPMQVDLTSCREKLTLLFDNVSAQWHHLGEVEPHWSVLTDERFVKNNFPDHRDAFYMSGQSEVKVYESVLSRNRVRGDGWVRCVELGCGVGRVSVPLARKYQVLLALDISAKHLQVAESYAAEVGQRNIEFKHLDCIEDLDTIGEFDVLYSVIVLQHNAPPVMVRMLKSLLRQLRKGGIAYIQIPTYQAKYRFSMDDYLKIKNRQKMEMHFLPQMELFKLFQDYRCQILEVREDNSIGMPVTAVSNTVLVQKY